MSDPYIGEIRMFAGSFPPVGWMFCDGQLIPISENDALFILLGTTYGGDGQETFALPNLQSRVPIHAGQGPGISQNYQLGESGGVESVTLNTQQIPSHTHPMLASLNTATAQQPASNVIGKSTSIDMFINAQPSTPLAPSAITPVGGSQPHDNMQPYLTISYIISLFGIFPNQN
jgi:microcystin-dependent protein